MSDKRKREREKNTFNGWKRRTKKRSDWEWQIERDATTSYEKFFSWIRLFACINQNPMCCFWLANVLLMCVLSCEIQSKLVFPWIKIVLCPYRCICMYEGACVHDRKSCVPCLYITCNDLIVVILYCVALAISWFSLPIYSISLSLASRFASSFVLLAFSVKRTVNETKTVSDMAS